MGLIRLYRMFAIALIGLYMAIQIAGSAHAAQYGDSPHEHDGIACAMCIHAQDEAVILPSQNAFLEPINDTPQPYIAAYKSVSYLIPPGRAPPPRSPPFSA